MSSAAQINKIVYWDKRKFETSGEKTSTPGSFVGVLGEIFYMISKGAPSIYKIEIKVFETWELLAEGTLEQDKLAIVDIDFYIPEARLLVTPKTLDAVVTAMAWGYPAVYIRTPIDDIKDGLS